MNLELWSCSAACSVSRTPNTIVSSAIVLTRPPFHTEDGRTYWRNRRHLRLARDPFHTTSFPDFSTNVHHQDKPVTSAKFPDYPVLDYQCRDPRKFHSGPASTRQKPGFQISRPYCATFPISDTGKKRKNAPEFSTGLPYGDPVINTSLASS